MNVHMHHTYECAHASHIWMCTCVHDLFIQLMYIIHIQLIHTKYKWRLCPRNGQSSKRCMFVHVCACLCMLAFYTHVLHRNGACLCMFACYTHHKWFIMRRTHSLIYTIYSHKTFTQGMIWDFVLEDVHWLVFLHIIRKETSDMKLNYIRLQYIHPMHISTHLIYTTHLHTYSHNASTQDITRDFVLEVVQRPAVLAGNSIGGYTALCAAVSLKEMCKVCVSIRIRLFSLWYVSFHIRRLFSLWYVSFRYDTSLSIWYVSFRIRRLFSVCGGHEV